MKFIQVIVIVFCTFFTNIETFAQIGNYSELKSEELHQNTLSYPEMNTANILQLSAGIYILGLFLYLAHIDFNTTPIFHGKNLANRY